jgi:hypothetical protein
VTAIKNPVMQQALEAELERLKRTLKLGYELQMHWIPNEQAKLAGKVLGTCIYIYDQDDEAALDTLRHEFLDYAISQVIEPYKRVTNRLIALVNDLAYTRKERLVETLIQFINNEKPSDTP